MKLECSACGAVAEGIPARYNIFLKDICDVCFAEITRTHFLK